MSQKRLGTPMTNCEHQDRFATLGGYELCEQCAREQLGWLPCGVCGTLLPPGEGRCAEHIPAGEETVRMETLI